MLACCQCLLVSSDLLVLASTTPPDRRLCPPRSQVASSLAPPRTCAGLPRWGRLAAVRCLASAMAMQAGDSVTPCSPQVVGAAFAQQYYNVLHSSPEHVHKFYHDESFLGRPDSNGTMTCVTTMPGIIEQLLSTDFTSSLIQLENVDTQSSHKNGVLILVTGSFSCADIVKQRFTQSFFLAPQEDGGYFVLNDVLRYVPERPSTDIIEALDKHVNERTENATFPAEPSKEDVDPELPSAENVSVNDEAMNSPAIDNSEQGSNVHVETCVEIVTEDAVNIPEAAPAPPASAHKDVTKQSYASVVKVMKEGTPAAPVDKPKIKPKPLVKGADNGEKTTSLPAKPAHDADRTPPERGYSVFVKNLPFNATVEMVDKEFRKFGAIKPGGIQVRNHQPDRFCFGFIEFESQQSMIAAIEASPICFGSKDSYVEEKRSPTRVVNGVVTHGDNNGNARGSRFQPGRGGYPDNHPRGQAAGYVNNGNYRDGDNFRGRGSGPVNNGNYREGDNFRGRGAGSMNNGNYRDGDNMRNEFRNLNEYSGRSRGPPGNNYHQNGNIYRQNENGYWQSENGYRQSERGYQHNDNRQNDNGYRQNENGYRQNENRYRQNANGYRQNENNYYQNGKGYHEPRHFQGGNGRPARFNGPRQSAAAG